MRTEQEWDKWMLYDEDGFYDGIDPKAPEDVKAAYMKYIAEREAAAKDGPVAK